MPIRNLFTKIRRRRDHFVDVGFLSPPVSDGPNRDQRPESSDRAVRRENILCILCVFTSSINVRVSTGLKRENTKYTILGAAQWNYPVGTQYSVGDKNDS